MSLDVEYARRRRRARPDDVGTVPVPPETLQQVAERWRQAQAEGRDPEAR